MGWYEEEKEKRAFVLEETEKIISMLEDEAFFKDDEFEKWEELLRQWGNPYMGFMYLILEMYNHQFFKENFNRYFPDILLLKLKDPILFMSIMNIRLETWNGLFFSQKLIPFLKLKVKSQEFFMMESS